MSRLLTRLPRTIPPTAPLQLTLGSSRITITRGIVTDLETGGTRKAKQTAGKGFVSVGGQQDRGMPTSDKGDEPMPPKYSTSTGHTILPSLKQSVQQTMEHPEEWEGIHAEHICAVEEANSANAEKWEASRAGRDAERDVTEAWGSEMASDSTSTNAGRSSRTKGSSKRAAAAEGSSSKKPAPKKEASSSTTTSRKKSQPKETSPKKMRGKESTTAGAESSTNSPDYASPMDAHHSQPLPHSTMDTATGQQPIPPAPDTNFSSSSSSSAAGAAAGANTISEDSIPHLALHPNLSLGTTLSSISGSFTLEPQPRPAPTAIKPFATSSTAWISWTFIQSPQSNINVRGASRFARSHYSTSSSSSASTSTSTSQNITMATGLSGQQQQQQKKKEKPKTQAQLDEEVRMRMEENVAGEGGAAGVEYEDGKAVGMKRGVRENMFRYI
ncbi:hypothetical protein NEUTE1DRAFT_88391 [Neurospora tetrasperma FGSC 2508]|uniref:Uncharacterized protein n=1 Tax=Neurospora tetrasperma (strain FGSC 2508 / ATCC MYA-4615 / P0657) TaxID=510951 RepID=F8MVN2_NEUT8|nr:uncharacterized protein NEUTE1DRAFT_88391 [Neurospora tetrasperma FGSC 2508]EGO54783.1 hypothetical protein NEUTE1DRAFT_88391 [Neurospora tetrasperma FGSC 2508]EGZ67733.1 hypothetical protein NEUTE2DRAFT_116940 [Neurospora tetrasperma FGSC 2509]